MTSNCHTSASRIRFATLIFGSGCKPCLFQRNIDSVARGLEDPKLEVLAPQTRGGNRNVDENDLLLFRNLFAVEWDGIVTLCLASTPVYSSGPVAEQIRSGFLSGAFQFSAPPIAAMVRWSERQSTRGALRRAFSHHPVAMTRM
jgi:hypothetical protein